MLYGGKKGTVVTWGDDQGIWLLPEIAFLFLSEGASLIRPTGVLFVLSDGAALIRPTRVLFVLSGGATLI